MGRKKTPETFPEPLALVGPESEPQPLPQLEGLATALGREGYDYVVVKPKKYEYRAIAATGTSQEVELNGRLTVINTKASAVFEELANQLGQEGWQLVAVTRESGVYTGFFSRAL